MKFILGTKQKMTQIWDNDKFLAVTPVQVGPCTVFKLKTTAKDGYNAVALAYGERKAKNISKPVLGQVKSLNLSPKYLKEFKLKDNTDIVVGSVIKADTFTVGDVVDAIGTSKGKGFQGVVKRHNFAGHKATHGNKDQERSSGSIGPKGPAKVFKNTRMAGRMGGDRVSVKNLLVVGVDEENNIVYLRGAVPGCISSLIMLRTENGDLKLHDANEKVKIVEEVKQDEVVVEDSVSVDENIEEKFTAVVEETAPVVEESVVAEEVKEDVLVEEKKD